MAQRTVKGFVAFIKEKSGTNARGPWTAYSIKLIDESGNEDPRWYQFGFVKPPFKSDKDTDGHGDYVKFDVTDKDDKVSQFVPDTGSIVKSPPARAAAQPKATGGKSYGGGGGRATVTKSDLFGKIGGYNTEDDVRRMAYANARSAAIETVDVLLKHDALVITKATQKANQAKRFEEVTAAIDKLTVKFFFDAAGGRLLSSVEDYGDGHEKVTPLPEDHDQHADAPENQEQDEDLPPDPDEEEEDEEVTKF